MSRALEEILRWTSPTPYNRRTATRDVDVAGKRIKAGEKVTLWWASANRDEQPFENPFTLDICRENNAHLAFGSGALGCLGAQQQARRYSSNASALQRVIVIDCLNSRLS